MRRWLAALLLPLLYLARPATAEEAHHTFWVVKGPHNTLYLLGSVHVLKPADSDLPPEALQAYAAAAALVMELDLNDPAAVALLAQDSSLELLPAGRTLPAALGPAAYRRFATHVRSLGLKPAAFGHFQPWFAAMAMQQAELTQQGFEASAGVDEQFAQRAAADHKRIIGLETVEQQLGMFAHLPMKQQRRLLLYMLDDADDAAQSADAVVAAWRDGDTHELERLLSESAGQYPELFRMLTTDRNQRWLPTLTQLLQQSQDYLVIVGALHLVGPDGLVRLLQSQGYEVVQH